MEDKYASLAPVLLGIAHEFRNPIQGILASLGVLRTRLDEDETLRPFLDMIARDSGRINDLITELLQLAHPIKPDPQPHQISNLIVTATRMVEEERSARDATIRVQTEADLPVLHADGQMLTKAFRELLINALETQPRNVHVEIKVSLKPDRTLMVIISDNGGGITQEARERLLEPFFSTRPKKAGLGLCLVDRVVRAHGGNLEFESHPGKETHVLITLPVAQ